jgi:hypothetical protein
VEDAAAADGKAPDPQSAVAATSDEPAPEALVPGEPAWLPPLAGYGRRTWPWAMAASLLILMLAGQLVHAYRSRLATLPPIGQSLQGFYASLGIDVTQRMDLTQYELLDLAFATESDPDGQGWLVIEARLRNNGPRVQPFPHIFVALKDRWQQVIAGRYFEPAEYSAASYDDYAQLTVGSVVDAQFIIVDPGPEVTAYEVQICTQAGQDFTCDGDEIFE